MKDFLNRDVKPGDIVIAGGRNTLHVSMVVSMSQKTANLAGFGRTAYTSMMVVDKEYLASNEDMMEKVEMLIREYSDHINHEIPKPATAVNTQRYVIAIGYNESEKKLSAIIHPCADKTYSATRDAEREISKLFDDAGFAPKFPMSNSWTRRWHTVNSNGLGTNRIHKLTETYDAHTLPMASLKQLGLDCRVGEIIQMDEFKTLIGSPIQGLDDLINKLT